MPSLTNAAEVYAMHLSERTKRYIDMMLAPFIGTRVKIYVGTCVSVNSQLRTMQISMAGVPNFTAKWGAPNLPGNPLRKRVRLLLDSRTRQVWFDDILPDQFGNG